MGMQVEFHHFTLKCLKFSLQITAFEQQQPVTKGVPLPRPDQLGRPLTEFRKGSNGPAHHKVETPRRQRLRPGLLGRHVVQRQGLSYRLNDFYLFADGIDQVEGTVRK